MKIAIFASFSQGKGGGVGRVTHELAEAMSSKGHSVLLVQPGRKTVIEQTNNLKKLYIKSIGNGDIDLPLLTIKNIKTVFKALDDLSPDIVHVHDQGSLPMLGLGWAKSTRTPFIMTIHILATKITDFGMSDVFKKLKFMVTPKIALLYSNTVYKNTDAFIVLNDAAEKEMAKVGYSDNVYKIPNGRNIKVFNQCSIPDVEKKDKTLIFTGHLTARKNQDYLIDVMKYLPDNYNLLLVGKHLDEDYLSQMKLKIENNLRESSNRCGKVSIMGEVGFSKIPKVLEKSHLFVSASKMEVQSLAVIEALASGKPVVGLSNETIDELIDDSVGKRLDKDTRPKEFAHEVERILNLPKDKYLNMCANCRERVSNLDWSVIVDRTVELYSSLLREKDNTKNKDRWEILKDIFPKDLNSEVDIKVISKSVALFFKGHRVGLKWRRFVVGSFIGTAIIIMLFFAEQGVEKIDNRLSKFFEILDS